MILLDTNVVSALLRPLVEPKVRAWMSFQAGVLIVVPTVALVELSYGIERLPQGRKRAAIASQLEGFLALDGGVEIASLNEIAARRAGVFMAQRAAAGRPVAAADMMIAGIAAANNAALATRNVRDFEGLGLALIDPWASVA